jgi:hypothetical protein
MAALRTRLLKDATSVNKEHLKRSALTLYPLVFTLLNLIQLGLNVCQCPENFPPGFVLIFQAVLSLGMLRPVTDGVTLLYPFALHSFFKGSHHEVSFLHEFVD